MPSRIKITASIFVMFTAVSTIALFYTAYVHIGVAGAVRKIDVSIQGFVVTFNNATGSVRTELSILNPSEFTFEAVGFRQTLYLNGKYVVEKWLVYLYIEPLIIGPFSNSSLTVTTDNVAIPEGTNELEQNWLISIFINLRTPLPNNVRLDFDKPVIL